MAAAATLLRGPLRQVGSSPRRALGRPVPSLNLLLSPRQVSGLLKRRFHRSAPAAVQVNGSEAGPGREGVLGPESRPEAGGHRGPWRRPRPAKNSSAFVPARCHSH